MSVPGEGAGDDPEDFRLAMLILSDQDPLAGCIRRDSARGRKTATGAAFRGRSRATAIQIASARAFSEEGSAWVWLTPTSSVALPAAPAQPLPQ